ncbi:MAG: MptD family putative ECF transporter S component [Propionibacteriaceae bacterium]|jgi:energy-coupling factor transport system substrate-specific component|nr:MptD family putative ECF transporter S component [Propionibacteriaceae bacterium]
MTELTTEPAPAATALAEAAPDRAGRPKPSFRFTPRDLINVGIFAALYIVVEYAINMVGLVNPLVMVGALCLSMAASAVVFMLYLTRVRHAGQILLFAILIAAIMVLTGHPVVSGAVTVVVAALAEVVAWVGRYRSKRASVLAAAVFTTWYVGPMLPLFYAAEDYYAAPSMQAMGQDYIDAMQALLSTPVLLGFDIATFVFGLLGGLLGLRLLRKHFTKAGLA